MKKTWIFVFALLLFACGQDSDKQALVSLAKKGEIQSDASIKAETTAMIKAPIEVVWMRITRMKDWPKWFEAISDVSYRGRLKQGRKFTWKANGTEMASEVVVYEPLKTIAWVSESSGVKAIHVWHLDAVDDYNTMILVKESRDGFLINWFYSSEELKDFLQNWVTALQQSLGKSSTVDF